MKYLIRSQNKSDALKKVRGAVGGFFWLLLSKTLRAVSTPSRHIDLRANFHCSKASGQCIGGIKLI